MTRTATADADPPLEREPGRMQHLSPTVIRESKTNPRRTVKDAGFEDLVKSVAELGIVQPILVRPVGDVFEIVAGHRRFAAARQAKLQFIPAVIQQLTDKEALERQVVENLQRSDLHPLEEAQGYEQLMAAHGYTAEQLADRVSKSKAYIYARLKLCALAKPARAAFLENNIDASTALLIARLPGQLQEKATKEVLAGRQDYGQVNLKDTGALERKDRGAEKRPLSFREASRLVHANYMLRLTGAPFDVADPALVKGAGPCGSCPKRTGNQPELFGDVKNADVCTDPICFAKKRDAGWQREADAAEAAGRKVLSDSQTKKIFRTYQPKHVEHGAPYLDLDSIADYGIGKGGTWRQVLKKGLATKEVPTVLARDLEGGRHDLIERSSLGKLLKLSGIKQKSSGVSSPHRSSGESTPRPAGPQQWDITQRASLLMGVAAGDVAAKLTPEKFVRAFGVASAMGPKEHKEYQALKLPELQRRMAVELADCAGDMNGVAAAFGVDVKAYYKMAKEELTAAFEKKKVESKAKKKSVTKKAKKK